jgi:hypothetical protein
MVSFRLAVTLKATSRTDIGNSKVTSVASQILGYDPEAMLWQDSPSPSLMLPSLFKWAVIVVIWLAVLTVLRPSPLQVSTTSNPEIQETVQAKSQKAKKNKLTSSQANNTVAQPKKSGESRSDVYEWTLYLGLLVVLYQFFGHAKWFLTLKNISYKLASQRLTIESGIFSKTINSYELHQLGSGQVYKPWNLRLFGRENLYVSGLWLSGIRSAEAVRDLIRNAGQIEASRIEKARFR